MAGRTALSNASVNCGSQTASGSRDRGRKEFEDLSGLLLLEMAFKGIEVVGRTDDLGIDLRAILVSGDVIRIRVAI